MCDVSRSSDLLFAQTNEGGLHVYEAETGKHIWTASIGEHTPNARPVSSNSFAVFGTSADVLTALDRKTGRFLWRTRLGAIRRAAPSPMKSGSWWERSKGG